MPIGFSKRYNCEQNPSPIPVFQSILNEYDIDRYLAFFRYLLSIVTLNIHIVESSFKVESRLKKCTIYRAADATSNIRSADSLFLVPSLPSVTFASLDADFIILVQFCEVLTVFDRAFSKILFIR